GLFLLFASIFVLMPAEISVVLTCFASVPCFGCSVVFWGCSRCSWEKTSAAGAKSSAIAAVIISLRIILIPPFSLRLLIVAWLLLQFIGLVTDSARTFL